eukprot:scaffold319401_cov43-Prasinocladus_malaysianus.AAC.1
MQVVLTDGDVSSLDLARTNIRINDDLAAKSGDSFRLRERVRLLQLRWGQQSSDKVFHPF